MKDFPIEFVFMLINSFVINDVCKNLKENVNIKVKSKHKESGLSYFILKKLEDRFE